MRTITIDGCSICQLKCPQCPVSQMGYQNTIGSGYLHWQDFQNLLASNPRIRHIEFDNFGELFLNKDLFSILQIAWENRVMLSCAGGVNLNNANRDILKQLVACRFQYLNVSIDGASQDTYSQYRIGGNFNTVIDNIRKINEYKLQYKSPYPKLQWQFVVFGHNEHEIPEARKMAKRLGMRFYPKMNWNGEYSPIKDTSFVKQQTGWDVTSREEYEKKYGVSYVRPTCYQIWDSPRLSWDLSVTGCCWNVWKRFDEYTLKYAKRELMGNGNGRTNIPMAPCVGCEIYENILASERYLTRYEIQKHLWKKRIATEIQYRLWRMNI